MFTELNHSFFYSHTQQKAWWIIVFTVLFFHLILLLCGLSWSITSEKKLPTKLVVSTIPLQPQFTSLPSIPPQNNDVTLAKADSLPPRLNDLESKPTKPKELIKPQKTVEEKEEATPPKKIETKKENSPSANIKKTNSIPKKVSEIKKNEQPKAKAPTSQTKLDKQKKEEASLKETEKKLQQELEAKQEAVRKKEQELLAKAKENLAKIGVTKHKTIPKSPSKNEESSLPKQIQNLHIDSLPQGNAVQGGLNAKEISYRDEIAHRLKLSLKLPDYGSVQIKLTIDRSGKVAEMIITKSESAKNQQYLEKNLPTIYFPSFGTQFSGLSQYTFLITLNNDY
jgi:colicin import membrane protein